LAFRTFGAVARPLAALMLCGLLAGCQATAAAKPLRIGLTAPLSGGSATSGEAIQRGMQLAINEINQAGGVLGRPLERVARDVQNDPAAGVATLRELVQQQEIVATFGGVFSPVMLAQLDTAHELHVPLINPWGSISEITRNGRNPNYAFSVSAIDLSADEFLARYTREIVGARRPGFLVDTTAWGDSNAAGLSGWMAQLGTSATGVGRFQQGETDMRQQLERLRAAGSDALIMATTAPDGAFIVRALASMGWKVPLVSHWGIGAAEFLRVAGVDNAEGVLTLQTYSFYGAQSARGEALLRAYHARFGTRRIDEVVAPVGVANGYDGVQLLAQAIRQAGSSDGAKIRDALERLPPYDGVVKRYDPAFTPERHDALLAEDYLMAIWQNGQLIPSPRPRLSS
jgi:branched-chain amino acid transport system substrate-binding protein